MDSALISRVIIVALVVIPLVERQSTIAAPPPLPSAEPGVVTAAPETVWLETVWPENVVAEARTACVALLAGRDNNAELLPPIRNGACGAPAPVLLKGFLRPQPLSFSPAPTVACPLAEALRRWLESVVQPAAAEALHDRVTAVMIQDAYNCRHRNSDPAQKLSNHAAALAIDVAGFVTARGEFVTVEEYGTRDDPRSVFLHRVHQGACNLFGTTLGPQANALHAAHFHLDMQQRKRPLCE